MKRDRAERSRHLYWGVLLVAAGVILFLGQLDIVSTGPLWSLWPAVLIVLGLGWMLSPSDRKQLGSGLSFILLGLWFFACQNHWWDLSYRTGWPLLIAIFGLEFVVTSVLDRRPPAKKEASDA